MLVRFSASFPRISWELRSAHSVLFALIVAGGAGVGFVAQMPIGDAVYFAFVTDLTLGYGDIAATTAVGRTISVLPGFVGVLFTGVAVAIAVRALRQARDETRTPGFQGRDVLA